MKYLNVNCQNQIDLLKKSCAEAIDLCRAPIDDVLKRYGVKHIYEVREIDESAWNILRYRYAEEIMSKDKK